MTELLYLTDSYCKSFDAVITEAIGRSVVLDKTAFYYLGGGQPFDRGMLTAGDKTLHVSKVMKRGPRIIHIVDDEPPAPGTTVSGEIDWDYRYEKMRLHTALHVLVGLLFRNYIKYGAEEPVMVSSVDIYEDTPEARVDFTLETLTKDLAGIIIDDANEIIRKGGPVNINFLSREEAEKNPDLSRLINLTSPIPKSVTEVRTVEIEGLDTQFDGGTHVKELQEIGGIKLVKAENKGKGRKRLKIALT
ncbi:MAG: alanyl-tRNA editing protein [Candidatus Heimdallarchaeota archaeon]